MTPRAPANEAPMAEQIAAISSSAWKVTTPCSASRAMTWSSGEAGVIGYEPKTSRPIPAERVPESSPNAVASVPVTVR